MRSSRNLPGKSVSTSPTAIVNKPCPGTSSISSPATSSTTPNKFFAGQQREPQRWTLAPRVQRPTVLVREIVARQSNQRPADRDRRQREHRDRSGDKPPQQRVIGFSPVECCVNPLHAFGVSGFVGDPSKTCAVNNRRTSRRTNYLGKRVYYLALSSLVVSLPFASRREKMTFGALFARSSCFRGDPQRIASAYLEFWQNVQRRDPAPLKGVLQ